MLPIGPAGRTSLSDAEIAVLHAHVDRGGGLLVLGTYTGDWHHSAHLNRLLERYGVALNRDVVTRTPDDGFNQRMEFGAESRAAVTTVPVRKPPGGEMPAHAMAVVSGVRSVLTISSCSLYVDPAAAVPLLETTDTAVVLEPIPLGVSIRIRQYLPRPSGPVVVAAASRRHRVAVVGGWKTFTDGLVTHPGSDNGRFWSNMVAWLSGEKVAEADRADPPERSGTSGTESARSWILVAGSGNKVLPDQFVATCERLGRELAGAGFGLVSGGWPGVDHAVARAFAGAVRGTKGKLADRLLQVLPDGSLPEFPGGRFATEPTEDEAWQRSVRECDAVVLVGGIGGTYTTAEMAWQLGKPVLPLADAREDGHDDSRRAYFHMYQNWPRLGIPGMSRDEFARVAEPVPEVVVDVVELLKRILGRP